MIWFTEVDVQVTTHDGEREVWSAGKIAPRLQPYVEPSPEGEVHHFWLLKSYEGALEGTNGAPAPGLAPEYPSLGSHMVWGRLLVDGLATRHVVPAAIVNLAGGAQPRLSLDRLDVLSWRSEEALARFSQCLPRRLQAGPLTADWMHALYSLSPHLLQDLWRRAEQAGASWCYGEGLPLYRCTERLFFPVDDALHTGAPVADILLSLWRFEYWGRKSPRPSTEPRWMLHGDQLASMVPRLNAAGLILPCPLDGKQIDPRILASWCERHAGLVEAHALWQGISKAGLRIEAGRMAERLLEVSETLAERASVCLPSLLRILEVLDIPVSAWSPDVERLDRLSEDERSLLRPPGRRYPYLGAFTSGYLLWLSQQEGRSIEGCAQILSELALALGLPAPEWDVAALRSIGPLTDQDRTLLSRDLDGELPWRSQAFTPYDLWCIREKLGAVPLPRLRMLSLGMGWEPPLASWDLNALGTVDSNGLELRLMSQDGDADAPWQRDGFSRHAVLRCFLNSDYDRFQSALQTVASALRWPLPSLDHAALQELKPALLEEMAWLPGILKYLAASITWRANLSIFLLWVARSAERPVTECFEVVCRLSTAMGILPPQLDLDSLAGAGPLTMHDWSMLSTELYAQGAPDWLEGKYRVGRMLALSAHLGKPLWWLDERLRALAPLGVEPPAEDATYLGIAWSSLVANSRLMHPTLDDDQG